MSATNLAAETGSGPAPFRPAGSACGLHFQPIIRLADGAMVAVEALARFADGKGGLHGPGAGQIAGWAAGRGDPHYRRTLAEAAALAARLHRVGRGIAVSINLSATDLRDPELPAVLAEAFRAHALPRGALKIELLESEAITDPAAMADRFGALQAIGARIALDDFGAGHSALAWLAHLPADEVKLDLAFARELSPHHGRQRRVVGAMIALAHDLGMQVIAEGVEDAATARAFAELGCDCAQGFHFARPMAGAELLHPLPGPGLTDPGLAGPGRGPAA